MTRRRWWLLVLGLAVALSALRWPGVVARSLWYDEAISLLEVGDEVGAWPEGVVPASQARARLTGAAPVARIVDTLRRTDVHPPAYSLLLRGWRALTGPSIEAARGLSVLCSGLMIAAFGLFLWGRLPTGQAIVAMLTLGLASGAVVAGYDARNYALALAEAAALLALAGAMEQEEGRARAAAAVGVGLVMALSLATHYLALPFVAAVALWLGACLGRRGRRDLLIALGIAAGISLLGAPSLLGQLGSRGHQDAGAPPFFTSLVEAAVSTGEAVYWPMMGDGGLAPPSGLRAASAAWLILALGLALWETRRAQGSRRRLLLLGWLSAALPPLALVAMNQGFDKHLTAPRYALMALPGIALLVGAGARPLFTRLGAVGAFGVIALLTTLQLTGINLLLSATPGPFGGSDARAAIPLLLASAPERTLFLVGAGFGRGHPGVYAYELPGDAPMAILTPKTPPEAVAAWTAPFDGVWYLPSGEAPTAAVEAAAERLLLERRAPVQRIGLRLLFGPPRAQAPGVEAAPPADPSAPEASE